MYGSFMCVHASAMAMAPSLVMLLSFKYNLLSVVFTFNSSATIFASSSPIPQYVKFTTSFPFFNCSILSYNQPNQHQHPSTSSLSLTSNICSSNSLHIFSVFFLCAGSIIAIDSFLPPISSSYFPLFPIPPPVPSFLLSPNTSIPTTPQPF
eukprot:TRINITY_DN720_c0_g1_i7.p1 TRINITY_DN720_c0_g1~~TRINITY_DN720_c0_g1_i7.p1  ORF type:complete len:151 (+),score=28.85 TRINITY_DN720_c0_g1_i7:1-453(+)